MKIVLHLKYNPQMLKNKNIVHFLNVILLLIPIQKVYISFKIQKKNKHRFTLKSNAFRTFLFNVSGLIPRKQFRFFE